MQIGKVSTSRQDLFLNRYALPYWTACKGYWNVNSNLFYSLFSYCIHSLVIIFVDLLTGLPKYALDRLQRVMNAATDDVDTAES